MAIITEDFVDRDEPLTTLWAMARGEIPRRVLLIYGEHGIGKNYLAEEFRLECQAEGITHVWLPPPESKDRRYISYVLSIWDQLGLRDRAELLTKFRPGQPPEVVKTPGQPTERAPAAAQTAAAPPAARIGGVDFHGSAEINAPVIGGGVTGDVIYTAYNQYIQSEDRDAQDQAQYEVTRLLRERLGEIFPGRRAVFVFCPWERVAADSDSCSWVQDNLLTWIHAGQLSDAVAVIAGVDLPSLERLPARVEWLPLDCLPDEAVRTYWVKKRGLPAEAIPAVLEITAGFPLAVNLVAEKYEREGREALERLRQGSQPLDAATATARAVEGLLDALSPAVAGVVRRAAIPHWFDAELVKRLCAAEADFPEVNAHLRTFRFIHCDAQGLFTYSPGVRDYLLGWWQRTENREQYRNLSQTILAHFQALAQNTGPANRQALEQEVLYHLLVTDEAAGSRYLAERCEAALDVHQLGLAEQFVRHASEQQGLLSERGRCWLQYFQARLDLAYPRGDAGEATFEGQTTNAPDAIVQALARWNLGQIRVGQGRWSDAVEIYRDSLDALRKAGEASYAIRVMLAFGDAYRDLADNCGGFQLSSGEPQRALSRLLYRIQHLPFLIYEDLVHRLSFLPNWSFGTDYQDWIIAYLLNQAASWYRKAEGELPTAGANPLRVQVRLSLADLEHQLGRWSRAQRRYAELLDAEEIKQSRYRQARVLLGQGRAYVSEGKLSLAEDALVQALPALREVGEKRGVGLANALLGRIQAASGRVDEGAASYGESAQAFQAGGDDLRMTQVAWALEDLSEDRRISDDSRQAIARSLADIPERHYITRFPDTLLRWYRRLALLGALPLTYVLCFVLTLLLALTFGIIEGEIRLALAHLPGIGVSSVDVLILVAVALLPVPLTLWLYRLIYTLMGVAIVRVLGRRLIPIEREQPHTIITDAAHLTLRETRKDVRKNGGRQPVQTVAWSEVASWAAVDFVKVHSPIDLISSTMLRLDSGKVIVLDAITAGYAYLKRDIARRLKAAGSAARQPNLTFIVFDWRWILGIAAACFGFSAYRFFTHGLSGEYGTLEGSAQVGIVLAPFLTSFLPTLVLVAPAVILWRTIFHRVRLQRALKYQVETIRSWLLWLAASLVTVIAVLWILLMLLSSDTPAA